MGEGRPVFYYIVSNKEDVDIIQLNKADLVDELNQVVKGLEEARHILEKKVLGSSVIDPSDGEFDDALDSEIDGEPEGGRIALFTLDRILDEVVEIIAEEIDTLKHLSEKIEGQVE